MLPANRTVLRQEYTGYVRELLPGDAGVASASGSEARAIRFSTMARICEVLNCQPGDLLGYQK
jgi:Cro/C1-type HTH DNA-binding domain